MDWLDILKTEVTNCAEKLLCGKNIDQQIDYLTINHGKSK